MAIHKEKIDLVKESLYELLHVAEYSVTYKKTDKDLWGGNATGGILGFPAIVILFSIIDCLGSCFVHDKGFFVMIDGNKRKIKNSSQHIFVLNSKYFNLDLNEIDLNNIYSNVRSTITHNSLLPSGYILSPGDDEILPFNIAVNHLDKRIYFINIIPLYVVTKKAVEMFFDDIEKGDLQFNSSAIYSDISKRDTPALIEVEPTGLYEIPIKYWIKK